MNRKCEYPGCTHYLTSSTTFFMGWRNEEGKAVWGYVCASCDKRQGRRNLKRLAGMTTAQAIRFEGYCKETKEQ